MMHASPMALSLAYVHAAHSHDDMMGIVYYIDDHDDHDDHDDER